jgi:hypothetical protein
MGVIERLEDPREVRAAIRTGRLRGTRARRRGTCRPTSWCCPRRWPATSCCSPSATRDRARCSRSSTAATPSPGAARRAPTCTALSCDPAGPFPGRLVVSMRPIASSLVAPATAVTARYPLAHGAPLHVGSPAALGIDDLDAPDYGDPVPVAADEVPVFWACGVTAQAVALESRPEWMITHAPGCMVVTDVPHGALDLLGGGA